MTFATAAVRHPACLPQFRGGANVPARDAYAFPVDLRQWLIDELDETTARLKTQVLHRVPEERRREQAGGGSSILWVCFHAARHADLALSILTGRPLLLPALAGGAGGDGGGLEEEEQPWSPQLEPGDVDSYLADVLAAGRGYLGTVTGDVLDETPDTTSALKDAGVPTDTFDWLYRLWGDKPVSFLVRWPLMGHVGNHVGEMIATRNRLGLSPF